MGLNFSKSERSVHAICTYTKSSMVIPACASTSFSPSRSNLISSSIFSGAFPVFGSRPIRPATYSVFPARIASLNGNCALISPSLIALLVDCGVGCENAPRTVRIPATTKIITRKLLRRFIVCLHSNDLPDLPRECNTQTRLRQAARRGLRFDKEYQAGTRESQRVRVYSRGFSGEGEAAGRADCAGEGAAGADFDGLGRARAATILAVAALLIWQSWS